MLNFEELVWVIGVLEYLEQRFGGEVLIKTALHELEEELNCITSKYH